MVWKNETISQVYVNSQFRDKHAISVCHKTWDKVKNFFLVRKTFLHCTLLISLDFRGLLILSMHRKILAKIGHEETTDLCHSQCHPTEYVFDYLRVTACWDRE